MTTCDVAVVGAGPAGASAALGLARTGAKVVLLEREALPRYKTCGGGVVYRAARLTGLDLSPVVERSCRRASLHLHDIERHFTVERDAPLIAMTMRDRLDAFLVEAAVRAGAQVVAPARVRSLSTHRNRVCLGTEHGSLWADFVIAADGALGDVPRLAGWTDGRLAIPALEYEVPADARSLARFGSEPRFDVGNVPYGYAWVFPKATHLSVGVLSTRRGARDLHEHMSRYLALVGIEAVGEVQRHGYVIPVRRRAGSLVRGRVMLAGDAAGLADPLTAEGISYAIQSGQIAATVLSRGDGDERRVRTAYHAELNRELVPELRNGRFLAGLLYGRPTVRRWLFRAYGQPLTEAVADVFLGTRGYRQIPGHALRALARGLVPSGR